ncbi:MAG: helix-turn-helix transcriptional regulator, partial [Phycisphaerae bacterium]|nr:helix-turn-helix transcriptional regulator [Phycisphaerae bacterium]
ASLPEWIGKNLRHGASLQAMAEHLHRSVTHFRRTFRQAFGLSPGAYVRRLRLQEAARFLTETRIPIKQIARRVGYGEPPHFHRAFAREYHVTPGQYRIRHSLKG